MNKVIIKIVLALLFLLCLADMPYGFYQFVRFLALFGFGILAYHSYKKENAVEMLVYIALAILFQPLVKITLGRTIWNIVDIVVAGGLLLSLVVKHKK